MKTILFIQQKLVVGGAEKLLLTLLKNVNRRKFDVAVCVIENEKNTKYPIEYLGFPVIHLNRRCKLWNIWIIFDLCGLIKNGQYDIVQTSLFYANTHGRIAAYLAKVPIIVSEEHNIYHWKRFYHIWIDRILAKITHRIVACSQAVAEFTSRQEKIPLDKFCVIHNCVDIKEFTINETKEELRKRYGFGDEKIIISVGILKKQKGFPYLIGAFAKVREKINARLLIVGSGLEEERLKALANESVIFMGNREDIPALLKLSDVFALASIWEGFGISIIEAMTSDLPVVATNVDGIPEALGDTGFLVPPRDSDKLAEKIVQALSAKGTGRKRVLENFTPEHYWKKLSEMYDRKVE